MRVRVARLALSSTRASGVAARATLSCTELHALPQDPSFGTGGRVVLENNGNSAEASKAILQPDGRIVVVGTSPTTLSGSEVHVTRLNAEGTLDAAFGQNGIVSMNFGASSRGAAVAQQADGKLIVAGSIAQTTGYPQEPRPDDLRASMQMRSADRLDFAIALANQTCVRSRIADSDPVSV